MTGAEDSRRIRRVGHCLIMDGHQVAVIHTGSKTIIVVDSTAISAIESEFPDYIIRRSSEYDI